MTEKELTVIEGNKLIAAFMGATYHESWSNESYHCPEPTFDFGEPDNYPTAHASRHHTPVKLQYHASWDWLMPVWLKAKELFPFLIKSDAGGLPTYKTTELNQIIRRMEDNLIHGNIERFFASIVSFIQWYNSQKQINP